MKCRLIIVKRKNTHGTYHQWCAERFDSTDSVIQKMRRDLGWYYEGRSLGQLNPELQKRGQNLLKRKEAGRINMLYCESEGGVFLFNLFSYQDSAHCRECTSLHKQQQQGQNANIFPHLRGMFGNTLLERKLICFVANYFGSGFNEPFTVKDKENNQTFSLSLFG